jgi:hypothetical protein
VHVADKETLIKYISGTGPNSILANLEYTPLNTKIHTAIRTALAGAGSHTRCLK